MKFIFVLVLTKWTMWVKALASPKSKLQGALQAVTVLFQDRNFEDKKHVSCKRLLWESFQMSGDKRQRPQWPLVPPS